MVFRNLSARSPNYIYPLHHDSLKDFSASEFQIAIMASRKRKASQAAGLKETVKKINKQKASDLDDFMVIGIDFGTT